MTTRILQGLACTALGLVLIFCLGRAEEAKISLPEGAIARLGLGRITGNVVFSPDGRYLAVGTALGIELWDAETLDLVSFFHGHTMDVYCLAFSPDGKLLASGSWDGTVLLWHMVPFQP